MRLVERLFYTIACFVFFAFHLPGPLEIHAASPIFSREAHNMVTPAEMTTQRRQSGVEDFDVGSQTMIGALQSHVVRKKDTLLDVARDYDLGFNEIQDLYPDLDPWIPPHGLKLIIPSQWIIPEAVQNGIVINVAELRLYYFDKKYDMIMTFPIGIGDIDWMTPTGTFWIEEKREKPTWYIPPSLQAKYGVKTIPYGASNPLGDYFMGLSGSDYGIHGTDIPWSVGRLVTHGCIRLYPEDIQRLFHVVKTGTIVKIIYEPVKICVHAGRVYAEAHKDIYGKLTDFVQYGYEKLQVKNFIKYVDMVKYHQVLECQDGMPADITNLSMFTKNEGVFVRNAGLR